jgi:endonuclease YncB( thermonuclease family)
MRFLLAPLLATLLLTGVAQAKAPRTFTGTVTSVVDGDTVWVRPSRGGAAIEIRVQGIDAPESCQAWGRQAKDALRRHLLRRHVKVRDVGRDTYGRHLARLARDGQDVGAWMVHNGLAWAGRWRGRAGPYTDLQAQAVQARRGLWSQPAMEPWRFRRQHGACPRPGR